MTEKVVFDENWKINSYFLGSFCLLLNKLKEGEMFSQQEQDQQRGRDQQERIQWKNSYFNDKDVSQSFYLFACNWQFIIIQLIIFSQYSQITIHFSTRSMLQLEDDYLEIGQMKWMFVFVEFILTLALSYSVFWSNYFKINQQLSIITLWLLCSLNSWNYKVRVQLKQLKLQS